MSDNTFVSDLLKESESLMNREPYHPGEEIHESIEKQTDINKKILDNQPIHIEQMDNLINEIKVASESSSREARRASFLSIVSIVIAVISVIVSVILSLR